MKIYIIEDEENILKELSIFLEKYGYQCCSSQDFNNIVEHVITISPQLVLLDINLPIKDGFQICRELKEKTNIPVIILTSRSTDFDELLSLNIGADDFITKPYNPQILLARIQRVLTFHTNNAITSVLTHKGVTLDVMKATLCWDNQTVELTKNEMGILKLLISQQGNIIPRDAIIDELWQTEEFIDENTLNVNIVRLRKKLSSIGLDDFLITKRGMGYSV